MVFSQPLWLLAALVLPFIWILSRRKGKIGHTRLEDLPDRALSGSSRFLRHFPRVLIALAFIGLVLGLARPQRVYYEADTSVKSRDIIITVDKSGSMSAPIKGEMPKSIVSDPELDRDFPGKPKPGSSPAPSPQPGPYGGYYGRGGYDRSNSRLAMAQVAVLDFVKNRHANNTGDRIGVMLFDVYQYWSWPLTSDLKMVYRKVQFADQDMGSGTNFGDIDPGPIDAAMEHFGELGKARSKVIIMVTDGEDDLSPQTQDRLSKLLLDNHVRLYVIGVGETLANYDTPIIRFTDSVGGKVFRVERAGDLKSVFDQIDSLERSSIETYQTEKRQELFFDFIAFAVIFLCLGLLAQAAIVNE
ncbi:MAG: VWA domain-containing protein [Candidatus Melainabacteria bacterium]|jgi:hypothetical protein|nr:VWA domain-containing protein [Candidatus Melainabacteria bacterium]